ncbi:SEP-domain-containing protein [Punctularia strigosozonata HHB-11173 SS5]|uniref:SEP-domain-containing protein n=1 Tax=Punctularia strigosozonata (strain HHB-11173) TaxID=741275 RepID=R7S1E8_PUNST|nr:SEP-domain-containing protein [Punctularia strigosozonata HHB-11173 SS5]EIN04200.1 SEP-domain-containing protein [Punctularia strigosozonata HHB-11173 SS5]
MSRRIGRIGDWNNSSPGSSNNNSRQSSRGPRIATLRDATSGSGSGSAFGGGGFGGHDDDDEDDGHGHDHSHGDVPEHDEGESWYAGGERSGISVENPDRDRMRNIPGGDVVRDLLRRAAEAGPPPDLEPRSGSGRSAFFGGGHTLGSDEVDSTYVPDPDAPAQAEDDEPLAIRHIVFWREGFTVENGPLMRYDDPANAQVLNELNSGRAPPTILGVQPGQPVELRVERRLHDEYVPPPKTPVTAFAGSGNRLGSPIPAFTGPGSNRPSMPGGFPAASSSSRASASVSSSARPDRESISTRFEVDQTKPTTSVQIRLADGTRMVARMNLTHTVGDIRNFINASRPENNTRAYTIQTTFPAKVLEDDSQTIEAAGLVNSVVVQRWA